MEVVNWGKVALSIVVAAIAGSITDWFFFGFLFHAKYMVFPEVWKKNADGTSGEGKKIAMSSLVGLLSTAAFALLSVGIYLDTWHGALKLAVAVWLIAAVPMLANEHIFMKLHPALFVSHALGWLSRFVLTGLAFVYIVR